jgi:hypothetical protein
MGRDGNALVEVDAIARPITDTGGKQRHPQRLKGECCSSNFGGEVEALEESDAVSRE